MSESTSGRVASRSPLIVRYESRCRHGHLNTSTPASRPNAVEWLVEDFDALGCGTVFCSQPLGTIRRVEGLGARSTSVVVYDATQEARHG